MDLFNILFIGGILTICIICLSLIVLILKPISRNLLIKIFIVNFMITLALAILLIITIIISYHFK